MALQNYNYLQISLLEDTPRRRLRPDCCLSKTTDVVTLGDLDVAEPSVCFWPQGIFEKEDSASVNGSTCNEVSRSKGGTTKQHGSSTQPRSFSVVASFRLIRAICSSLSISTTVCLLEFDQELPVWQESTACTILSPLSPCPELFRGTLLQNEEYLLWGAEYFDLSEEAAFSEDGCRPSGPKEPTVATRVFCWMEFWTGSNDG